MLLNMHQHLQHAPFVIAQRDCFHRTDRMLDRVGGSGLTFLAELAGRETGGPWGNYRNGGHSR
jgi:hypothetical protein